MKGAINVSTMQENMERAFAASFAVDMTDKRIINLASADEAELLFEKYAGCPIYNPTAGNVTDFVRRYVEDELYKNYSTPDNARQFPVDVDLKVDSLDEHSPVKNGEKHIKDATGLASIKVNGTKVEIPFLIHDGELAAFDIIQVGNERVPYSTNGLRKICNGIAAYDSKKEKMDEISPYKELDSKNGIKSSSTLSTFGFLGDTMQIRDMAMGNRGGAYRTAQNLDNLLEKTSTLRRLSDADFERLEAIMDKAAEIRLRHSVEDLVKEASTEKMNPDEEILFKREQNRKYVDVKGLKDRTVVQFPIRKEKHRGAEMTVVKGLVLKDFLDYRDNRVKMDDQAEYNRDASDKPVCLVITEDGGVIFLNAQQSMVAEKMPEDTPFRIPLVELDRIQDGQHFIGIAPDGKLFTPVELVRRFERNLGTANEWDKPRKYRESGIFWDDERPGVWNQDNAAEGRYVTFFSVLPKSNFTMRQKNNYPTEIVGLEKTHFINLDPDKVSKILCKKYQLGDDKAFNDLRVGNKNTVYACPCSKVIPLTREICGYPATKKEVEQILKVAAKQEEGFEKTAAVTQGYIDITPIDRKEKTYNVEIRYTDKSKRMFNRMNQSFKGCSELKLRSIMKLLQFSTSDINNAILQAQNSSGYRADIPDEARPADFKQITGADSISNIKKDKLKETFGKFINVPALLTSFAALSTAGLGADAYKKHKKSQAEKKYGGHQMTFDDILGKKEASISRIEQMEKRAQVLSKEFEKIAMEKKSEEFLDLAKVATLSSLFADKVLDTIDGEVYVELPKVAATVAAEKETFEKLAGDLYQMKYDMLRTGHEPMSVSHVHGMIETMADTVDLANAVIKASDNSKK